ncbi:MAG: hypothetical protein ACP6IQ_02200 [Candidatus Njordarchaeia archaeon]
MFPLNNLIQEYPIKIRDDYGKIHTLFIDIFIPDLGLAFECHGIQHFKFVEHFHNDTGGFSRYKYNDNLKIKWCEENNVALIILDYKTKITQKLIRKEIGKCLKK